MKSVPAIAAKKITVRIVPWLIICLTMAYIDRTNLAFAQFSLAKSFGIDPLVLERLQGYFLLDILPQRFLVIYCCLDSVLGDGWQEL